MERGFTVWFTGLSGAGKTTIASALEPELRARGCKVEPNVRALAGKRAWVSGIRRDQSDTRRETGVVEWDEKFGLVKVNALAAWSEAQVWSYIVANDVPYNELHDRGYPSIGCTHCTKPVEPGADPRSGRWQGFDKTECGIHPSAGSGRSVQEPQAAV